MLEIPTTFLKKPVPGAYKVVANCRNISQNSRFQNISRYYSYFDNFNDYNNVMQWQLRQSKDKYRKNKTGQDKSGTIMKQTDRSRGKTATIRKFQCFVLHFFPLTESTHRVVSVSQSQCPLSVVCRLFHPMQFFPQRSYIVILGMVFICFQPFLKQY